MDKLKLRLKPKVAREIRAIAEIEGKEIGEVIIEMIMLGLQEKKRKIFQELRQVGEERNY